MKAEIPAFAIIVVIIVTCLLAVMALKMLSVFFNSLIGRRRDDQHSSASAVGIGALGLVVVCMIIAAGFFGVRTREVQLQKARQEAILADEEAARFQLQLVMSESSRLGDQIPETPESPQAPAAPSPAESRPSETIDSSAGSAAATADTGTKERERRRSELSQHIGNWIGSLLGEAPQQNNSGGIAQAAESSNGDVVVVQLSQQMAKKLLGESGQEMLESFNTDLPDRIRQTYALIPLTPPVEAAVSPMKPLLAAGRLEHIADSLVSFLQAAESKSAAETRTAAEPSTEIADAATLSDAPAIRPMPDWVRKPDGGRLVAETPPLAHDEDPEAPLQKAVNETLIQHIRLFTASLDPALQRQSDFVKLELDPETVRRCIVDRYERVEVIDAAGPQTMRKIYALVEFPESVDITALQAIRQSVQYDRIAGLGFIIVAVWLSVSSAGCGVRLWNGRTRLRRLSAVPLIGVVSVPLLLLAVAFSIVLARDQVPRPLWTQNQSAVKIHVDGPG